MDERCSIALSVRRGHWHPKYPGDGVGWGLKVAMSKAPS